MRVSSCFSAILLALLALSACSDEDKTPAAQAPTATAATSAPAVPAATPAPAAPAPAPAPAAPAEVVFTPEQLDQMLAPLALYPDSLLAQVLMAATYPGNVADAVAWSKAHPDASGDAAVKQVANQPWDPSVQSLVAFPQVLDTLGQDPAWVQKVGDAFLAQPDAVMDSVQRLRRKAQAAGHLESNEQQLVTVQPAAAAPEPAPAPADSTVAVQQAAPAQTIVIQPTNPQVVYVPSYNPSVVYGTWPYPSSPPAYYPPSPGYTIGTALAAGLAFGTGVAIVNSLWGDCDWDHHDVDIDVNRYNNLNVNRQLNVNQNTWQHNPINRNGVPYRDSASREQYGRRLAGTEQRDAFRGHDPARASERERARQSLSQHGIAAPATSNQQARERAQAAGRDLRNEPQLRERAQTAGRDSQARQRAQATVQSRQHAQTQGGGQQLRQRAQSNPQVRQQVRQQHARTQAPRNNAFVGARNPSQTHAYASRGQVSHAAASRPQASRAASRPVQRPAHAPSQGGGGGFHRR
ncbi:DUF3300 domain-containing protein [Pseudomonas cavernae]|uniref:DUF3300 domain-containing protein n=1 Tax=Pseudomonas cavernae TaxID=2320867 RepID=A0A385Z1B2_9PSED|nr:DUF3300 domain-containing protein [Pseudomonas cavernae]AYC32451.1 DUF3300 domain-containing protein [Pseudomonas cavernae]